MTLTLNDFQRKSSGHGGGGHYHTSPNGGGADQEQQSNGHDFSPEVKRNQSDSNRHDKENSVTSAIVTINSGGNGPGQGGHNGGPGPGPDQAGHIGPIQMYSSSTASIPDPAAQVKISNL